MQENETVLSDIHLYTENMKVDSTKLTDLLLSDDTSKQNTKVVESRFVFRLPPSVALNYTEQQEEGSFLLYDEDGDLLIRGRDDLSEQVITLDQFDPNNGRIFYLKSHFMATPLSLVGLQVWQGGLFLSDYLLHNGHNVIKDKYILELGAGSGLCSIVSAIFAQHVFCTDTGNTVMEICKRNAENNSYSYNYNKCEDSTSSVKLPTIKVKELEWRRESPVLYSTDNKWGWTSEELEDLQKVTVILAADVIYDDELTDAFFKTIQWLMIQGSPKILYLTLEKRYNFTLEDLDVACHAYDYFLTCCKNLMNNQENIHWNFQKLSTDFPQYFNYDRSPHLELWKIQHLST